LFSAVTVSPNPIQWNQGFTVNANIINKGTAAFYGDITAALFDESGNFVDFIDTYTESNGLPPNYYYTNGLNFSTTGLEAAPGQYFIRNLCEAGRRLDTGWQRKLLQLHTSAVVYGNNIELYADITPAPNPLVQKSARHALPGPGKLRVPQFSTVLFHWMFTTLTVTGYKRYKS
jgi:hypothetical protein